MPQFAVAATTVAAAPNPGSDAALAVGCTCPVLDNAHGEGFYGQPYVFIFTYGCPVHMVAGDTVGP